MLGWVYSFEPGLFFLRWVYVLQSGSIFWGGGSIFRTGSIFLRWVVSNFRADLCLGADLCFEISTGHAFGEWIYVSKFLPGPCFGNGFFRWPKFERRQKWPKKSTSTASAGSIERMHRRMTETAKNASKHGRHSNASKNGYNASKNGRISIEKCGQECMRRWPNSH